jgi:high-affinity Fe2+/Pb2+ permease
MINISIPAIWIAFFGALFGAMMGVALSFWFIKKEVQREVKRIENEYKYLLVQGLVGGVMKYFFKEEDSVNTAAAEKTQTEKQC